MSINSTFPIAKTALTNNIAPLGRIYLSINKNMLHDNTNNNNIKDKPKLLGRIKQSKLFNRKNKNTQYQGIRKEKTKSQKIPPPPSGSHPVKNTLIFLGGAAVFAFLFTGWPSKDDNPYDIDEWINRSKNQIKKLKEEPFVNKVLPDELPEPHCQKYTLLINLDDNLVKTTWDPESGWHVVKRPGVDFFIQYLSQFYEIVIFTNTKFETSSQIIDNIDPYGIVLNRLYHKDIKSITRRKQRDLNSLNRDIRKSIVIDIDKSSYRKHENNIITITPWNGNSDDNELLKLIPFFESMIITSPEDIRPVLKSYPEKNLSESFLKHQNQLREKFEKQNQEIIKNRKQKKNRKSKKNRKFK